MNISLGGWQSGEITHAQVYKLENVVEKYKFKTLYGETIEWYEIFVKNAMKIFETIDRFGSICSSL